MVPRGTLGRVNRFGAGRLAHSTCSITVSGELSAIGFGMLPAEEALDVIFDKWPDVQMLAGIIKS